MTSEVPSELEMWLCFLSPTSHSKTWNPLETILGGPSWGPSLCELLCDYITYPLALPEPKERRSSQAMVVY